MSKQLQKRPTAAPAVVVEQQCQQTPVNVIYVQSQHWLDAVCRLHPSAQVAAAVGAGVAVGLSIFALVSLVSVAGSLVAGLATFTLGLIALTGQFLVTIGAGVGILLLMIIAVTGILKL